jgi:hypothetical protein
MIVYTNADAQTGIIGVPVSDIPSGLIRKSLLSVLLGENAAPLEIFLVETIFDGEWDFGFWHYNSVGVICTFRCPQTCVLWRPVETPSYTGVVRPFDRDGFDGNKFGWMEADLD